MLQSPTVVTTWPGGAVRVERVEPSQWWLGMRQRRVLLLLSGPGVGTCRPRLSGAGLRLADCHLTESVNHMLLEVEIGPAASPGEYTITLEQGTAAVASCTLRLLSRRRGSAERQGLSSADAVYLAMPDRFAKGANAPAEAATMQEGVDPKSPRGRHGGNLAGVREHLDHLRRLQMTALWLTPVCEADMPTDSFHGYATTNYYHIDPRLGTDNDYRMLSAALHQRGMKLVMDLVPGHCGTSHPWVRDCPSLDWLNAWGGDPWACNHRPGVATDVHASHIDRRRTVEGWFAHTMADVNLDNPLVSWYMAQVCIYWTELADLDGLRLDTVPYNSPRGLRDVCSRIAQEYPQLTILCETWLAEASKLAPWEGLLSNAEGESLPGLILMDFPLQEAVVCAMQEDFNWGRGANRLYDALSNDHLYRHPERLLVFGDNHDTGRLLTRLGGDEAALRLALTFLATTRGVPQLYQGTEWLMTGDGLKGDEQLRRDMPAEWFEAAPAKQRDFAEWVGRLFGARKQCTQLQTGELTHYVPTDNLYVYFRHDAAGCVMVALNMRWKRTVIDAVNYRQFVPVGFAGVDLLDGHRVKSAQRLALKPRSALVLALER